MHRVNLIELERRSVRGVHACMECGAPLVHAAYVDITCEVDRGNTCLEHAQLWVWSKSAFDKARDRSAALNRGSC